MRAGTIRVMDTTYRAPLADTMAAQGRRRDWVASHLYPPVTPGTVSKWCSGERPIPPMRVVELAALLGVEPAQIASTEGLGAS